jgi:hypothetical protein
MGWRSIGDPIPEWDGCVMNLIPIMGMGMGIDIWMNIDSWG